MFVQNTTSLSTHTPLLLGRPPPDLLFIHPRLECLRKPFIEVMGHASMLGKGWQKHNTGGRPLHPDTNNRTEWVCGAADPTVAQ